MSVIQYKVKAKFGFCDGNILPRRLHFGEVVIVDEQTYLKMKMSDPESIDLIEQVIKNPKKDKND